MPPREINNLNSPLAKIRAVGCHNAFLVEIHLHLHLPMEDHPSLSQDLLQQRQLRRPERQLLKRRRLPSKRDSEEDYQSRLQDTQLRPLPVLLLNSSSSGCLILEHISMFHHMLPCLVGLQASVSVVNSPRLELL
jgi:hypothetical protein